MNVHIYLAGAELEAQKGRGLSPFRQQVRVGLRDSRGKRIGIHNSAVDRYVQVAPRWKADRERADEAPYRSSIIEWHEAPG